MFHITVAIARFFEFLLLDIARSVAALAALGLIALVGSVAALVGLRRLARRNINKR